VFGAVVVVAGQLPMVEAVVELVFGAVVVVAGQLPMVEAGLLEQLWS
jgi:ABC-type sulfate transport system permease component